MKPSETKRSAQRLGDLGNGGRASADKTREHFIFRLSTAAFLMSDLLIRFGCSLVLLVVVGIFK
jgi:hypothetical protein